MINEIMEMQKRLDERVLEEKGLTNPHISERILALLVEIGEMTNEWRRFKFWSENREPRREIKRTCSVCGGKGIVAVGLDRKHFECSLCGGSGVKFIPDRLLEEYVDGLHFVFSVGNAFQVDLSQVFTPVGNNGSEEEYTVVLHQLHALYAMISQHGVKMELPLYSWEAIMSEYLNLGTMLGFTLDQIHDAYIKKNKVNHERQESGY